MPDVSGELLIILSHSPLHDGAVLSEIIRLLYHVYLPHRKFKDFQEFGTLASLQSDSEVSDAFTFVGGRELGYFYHFYNGVFKRFISLQEFEEELRKVLAPDQPVKKVGISVYWEHRK